MVKALNSRALTLLLLASFLGSCATEPLSTADPLPLLHIQPSVFQLGDIKEGEEATATFFIRNNSQQTIELLDIQASCGCTVAEPDSFILAPNTFTQLQVHVDTTAKQQGIQKTVYVRDSLGHEASATLVFNVVDNPHFVATGKVKGIFDGQCASCHYEPALTKTTGVAIYNAACVMCHGAEGQGAYAPKLQGYASFAALKDVIVHGVGKPQMPAFARAHGGPLDNTQIETLAHWLMGLSSVEKP